MFLKNRSTYILFECRSCPVNNFSNIDRQRAQWFVSQWCGPPVPDVTPSCISIISFESQIYEFHRIFSFCVIMCRQIEATFWDWRVDGFTFAAYDDHSQEANLGNHLVNFCFWKVNVKLITCGSRDCILVTGSIAVQQMKSRSNLALSI